jgi:2-hydroxychromene-2-carboxylate isomerase
MSKRVRLFYSFRSPYSYLGGPRIFALPEKYAIDLQWHGVPPMVQRGVPLSPAKALYILRDAQRVAGRLGMPFQFPNPDPLEYSQGLLRGAEYAKDQGRLAPWVLAISGAVWGEQRDISDSAVVREITESAGLEAAPVQAAIEGNEEYDVRIASNADLLVEVGHWGVPTMEVDGELFWGQDRIDYLEAYLGEQGCRR